MADEFLRIGGRSEDGKAKPIKTDDEGNLGVNIYRKPPEKEVVFDGITESGHNATYTYVGDATVDELWLMVESDRPDWRVQTSLPPLTNHASYLTGVFPHLPPLNNRHLGYMNKVTSQHAPWRALIVFPPDSHPDAVWNDINKRFEYPDMKTAMENKNPQSELSIRLRRPSSGVPANITISILKIWRS